VRRVTAAVLIDHVPRPGANGKVTQQALSPAELARIEALVKEAVGFNADRGDSVSVMNAPFVRDADAGKDTTPVWRTRCCATSPSWARRCGGAGPAVRRAAPGPAPDHRPQAD
jgi:flagellar biosynthesis/type III secretory pathway M-ring protein FliF/YscJ